MARPSDITELARRLPCSEFVAQHECFFLVGDLSLEQPLPTDFSDTFESPKSDRTHLAARPEAMHAASGLLVLPVRKVHDEPTPVITVGRTNNNDIVVPDINVSRLHALFRVHSDRVDLADAGSANGTFINGKELAPKGPPQILVPGDAVSFAHLAFLFVGAAAAWERIRQAK